MTNQELVGSLFIVFGGAWALLSIILGNILDVLKEIRDILKQVRDILRVRS